MSVSLFGGALRAALDRQGYDDLARAPPIAVLDGSISGVDGRIRGVAQHARQAKERVSTGRHELAGVCLNPVIVVGRSREHAAPCLSAEPGATGNTLLARQGDDELATPLDVGIVEARGRAPAGAARTAGALGSGSFRPFSQVWSSRASSPALQASFGPGQITRHGNF